MEWQLLLKNITVSTIFSKQQLFLTSIIIFPDKQLLFFVPTIIFPCDQFDQWKQPFNPRKPTFNVGSISPHPGLHQSTDTDAQHEWAVRHVRSWVDQRSWPVTKTVRVIVLPLRPICPWKINCINYFDPQYYFFRTTILFFHGQTFLFSLAIYFFPDNNEPDWNLFHFFSYVFACFFNIGRNEAGPAKPRWCWIMKWNKPGKLCERGICSAPSTTRCLIVSWYVKSLLYMLVVLVV